MVIVIDGGVVILVQNSHIDHFRYTFMCQIRIDRTGAIAHQACNLMHVPGLAALQDQRDRCPLLRAHQMLLHRRDCQQCRDRYMVLIDASVRQDQDVISVRRGSVHCDVKLLEGMGQGRVLVIQQGNNPGAESFSVQGPDLDQIHACQDRIVDLQYPAVICFRFQKIAVRADVDCGIHDHLLTQRIDRRVRNLRKQLLEITVQQLMVLRQQSDRSIMPHGNRTLNPIFCHGKDLFLHILVRVSEYLVEAVSRLLAVNTDLLVRDRKPCQMEEAAVQPLSIRIGSGVHFLTLIIGNDPFLLCVHQQDLPRLQPGADLDMGRIDVQHAHLRCQDQTSGIRHIITRRTEPVAVQRRSQNLSV